MVSQIDIFGGIFDLETQIGNSTSHQYPTKFNTNVYEAIQDKIYDEFIFKTFNGLIFSCPLCVNLNLTT